MFLDIQMPQIDGLTLARTLGRTMPAVVFVTAYDECALGAFEVHALDYLLKPYSAERFKSALMHARQHLNARRKAGGQPSAYEQRDRLVIKVERPHFSSARATSTGARRPATTFGFTSVRTHLVRGTMAHIESQLDPAQFVRIHRSTIVNVDRIHELHSSFGGEYVVLLHDKTRLTLSRGVPRRPSGQAGDAVVAAYFTPSSTSSPFIS